MDIIMKLYEEFKLFEEMWEEKTDPVKESIAYTEKDFAWDDATIVADFKRAALAYMNGANLEDALHDIKVMIISGSCAKTDPADTQGLFRRECKKYGITEAVSDQTEANKSMYIIAPNGGAGGNIYYMGRDILAAQKQYKKDARDFVKYGMGGGDTAIELYEYKGDPTFFDAIYDEWKANNTNFTRDLTELGFDFADCITLESIDG
jgi:hypothetical protein